MNNKENKLNQLTLNNTTTNNKAKLLLFKKSVIVRSSYDQYLSFNFYFPQVMGIEPSKEFLLSNADHEIKFDHSRFKS